MGKYVIYGGKPLFGNVLAAGSKNVALKVIIASLLSKEQVTLKNIPSLSDLHVLEEIMSLFGTDISRTNSTMRLNSTKINPAEIPVEQSKKLRASFMLISPLLTRFSKVKIPNPGGDKIGARPIERSIEGLKKLGVEIDICGDGYICACKNGLKGATYKFEKNTHTGTETLILAAVLANGRTVLENAAEEPEIDDLIGFLNSLGADIKRQNKRTIIINGVKDLKGGTYEIMADRNEVITFAVAAYATHGRIYIPNANKENISAFLQKLDEINCVWKKVGLGLEFEYKNQIKNSNIETKPYPGFMTDWQAPWSLLMTQAQGDSMVHETIYEDRFGYVKELMKMGAKISLFNPKIENPKSFYNFNWNDRKKESFHAIKIHGPTVFTPNNVVIPDLRAGATLVLAALLAKGRTTLTGIEHIDRGYEKFENRLNSLGANIERIKE